MKEITLILFLVGLLTGSVSAQIAVGVGDDEIGIDLIPKDVEAGAVVCSDCDLGDLGDVDTSGVGDKYALIYNSGTSIWGAKSISGLTGWLIDASTNWLFNDSDTLYFNSSRLDKEYVTYEDFNAPIWGTNNITTRADITAWGHYCNKTDCYTLTDFLTGGADTQKNTTGIYLYNDSNTIYFNESSLNSTGDDRWLLLNGSNVNTNIDIRPYNLSVGNNLTIGSDGHIVFSGGNVFRINHGVYIDGSNPFLDVGSKLLVGEYADITEYLLVGEYAIIEDYLNVSNDLNVGGNITSAYISGQPLDGSIGSGVLNASSLKTHCGCINASDEGGLNVKYPDMKVKIWNYGTNVYCDISSNTVAVPDDAHTVYYVDSNCAVQTMSWTNYFAQNINPPNYARIFDVYTHDGDIELVKGASIIGITMRKSKFGKVNCGGKHLSVCDGMDITEGIFPEINMSAGHIQYINSVHTTQQRDSNPDGLHVVCGSDGSHTAETEIDIDKCDNGATCDACPTNQFRRYYIYSIGWGDHTGIHQLAPLDGSTYLHLGDCMNIEENPLDYVLPSMEEGVAVIRAFYCAKSGDTEWRDGAWVEIIADGGIGGSIQIATDDFMRYSGWGKNADASGFNLTGADSVYAGYFNGFNLSDLNAKNSSRWVSDGENISYSLGNVGIGTSSPGAKLEIEGDANEIQLIVQGDSTQSVNLQEWQNSAGTSLAYVNQVGSSKFVQLTTTGNIEIDGTGNAFIILDRNANNNFGAFQFQTAGSTIATVGLYNDGTENLVFNLDSADVGRRRTLILKPNDEAVFNDEGGDMDFRIEGDTEANLFMIDAGNDRVGIGINNPLGTLHINHKTAFNVSGGNAAGQDAILLKQTVGGQSAGDTISSIGWTRNSVDTRVAAIGLGLTADADQNDLVFYTHPSTSSVADIVEAMRIQYDGKVGIGINNPLAKLHVYSGASGQTPDTIGNDFAIEGSDHTGMSILAPEDKYRTIFFGTPDNDRSGAIWYGGGNLGADTNDMFFYTDGAERVRITYDGNVGIGTSSPGNRLDILTGSTTNSEFHLGELENEGFYITSTKDHIGVMSAGAEFVNNAWTARSTQASMISMADGDIYFRADESLTDGNTFTPTNRMFIRGSDGNVGIGTNNPERALHVKSSTASVLAKFESSYGGSYIDFVNTAVDGDAGMRYDVGGTNWIHGVDDSDEDKFKIGTGSLLTTSPKFVIQTDGKIGIGTISPAYNFHVYDNNGNVYGAFTSKVGSESGFVFGDKDDYAEASLIYNSATQKFTLRGFNNDDVITIDNSERVGIGTSSPTHKLNVVGSINITTDLLVEDDVVIGDDLTILGVPDGDEKYFLCIDASTGVVYKSIDACDAVH